MAQKTTVTITADGFCKVLSGDAVIVFAVDKVDEFESGKVKELEASTGYVGKEIPDSFFADTIASMLSVVIKRKSEGDPVMESFNLHMVSEYLKDESEKIMKGMTQQQQLRAMEFSIREMRRLGGEKRHGSTDK